MKHIDKNIWGLIGKRLNGEIAPEETEQLESWIQQSVENRTEYEECRKILEKTDLWIQAKKFDPENAWNAVGSKINSEQGRSTTMARRVYQQFYKYAAIIVIALLLGSLAYFIGTNTITTHHEIVSAEKQVVNEYVLPDGTRVSLNSQSKLVFPAKFNGDVREVSLTGEAFFNVTPNPEKPFVILAGNAQVKVLGTSFNVRAYPENETVEVVVETGKVQFSEQAVSAETGFKSVYLTPGEKGILVSRRHIPEKTLNTDRNFLAWKTRYLVFNETPLNEVVSHLENVYHVQVSLKDKQLKDLRLTATFDQKSIQFVLDVVRLTFDLNLEQENGQYILSNKK